MYNDFATDFTVKPEIAIKDVFFTAFLILLLITNFVILQIRKLLVCFGLLRTLAGKITFEA